MGEEKMFYGRENELRRIERRLALLNFQAIMVYGRRRIGKTELVRKAVQNSGKPCLELIARRTIPSLNLSDFGEEAARFMNAPAFRPNSFYELFSTLLAYSADHPFILFVDEFPFLSEGEEAVEASLQKAIELNMDKARVALILCGSYIEAMSRLVESDSPLYGRFNEILLLKPFDYKDAGAFSASLPLEERFRYYAVFGGTAFNLANLDYSIPFEDNLIDEFIRPDSFFEKEAVATIRNEITKDANANAILELIASGVRKYKDLNERLGDPGKDNIGRYVRKLEELGLIKKSYMVSDRLERKPLYCLKDNLLDFYYTYLFRSTRLREGMSPRVFYENFVREDFLTKYLPRKFEEVVKEYCYRENGLALPLFERAGRLFYHAREGGREINREFDVVLKNEDAYLPIECKFVDRPLTDKDVEEEIAQWEGLPFHVVRHGFASKAGFTEEVEKREDLLLIALDDLY